MKLKTKKTINKTWDRIFPELLLSLTIISFYLITVDLYQYLFTELWWKFDSLNYNYTTIYLILIILLFSFIDLRKLLIKKYLWQGIIILFFIFTLIGHKFYTNFYNELQTYPKIKSISKDWGIPGSWVKVTGRNFGAAWQPGKVYLGETEMTIKKWGDKEVIFEITTEVGGEEKELKIVNKHQKKQQEFFIFKINE